MGEKIRTLKIQSMKANPFEEFQGTSIQLSLRHTLAFRHLSLHFSLNQAADLVIANVCSSLL